MIEVLIACIYSLYNMKDQDLSNCLEVYKCYTAWSVFV